MTDKMAEWLAKWQEQLDGIGLDVFILDANKVPKPVTMFEWLKWRSKTPNPRVRSDVIFDEVQVSTIFLGLNHNMLGQGPPLLFETMVFGGEHHYHLVRCSTWAQAVKQHENVVAMIKRGRFTVVK